MYRRKKVKVYRRKKVKEKKKEKNGRGMGEIEKRETFFK